MSMNTAKLAWLVGRQFHKNYERFVSKEDAERFAFHYARNVFPDRVEVFECVSNVYLDAPVVTVTDQDKGQP